VNVNELLFSVLAQTGIGGTTGNKSTIDTQFLKSVQDLWCDLMDKNGPLVPIVAGAALAVFAVLFVLDEGKGYISMALRILIGIALLVFIPSVLMTAYGINMGCGTSVSPSGAGGISL